MIKITASANWKNAFPGAHIGLLLIGGVDNSQGASSLEARKRALEAEIGDKTASFSRADSLNL